MKRRPSVLSFIFLTSAAARVVLGVRVGVPSLNLGREVHAQAILYVDANANGPAQDGSSWCNAYVELAPALNAAYGGTTTRVADGEYDPDTAGFPNLRQATLQLKNGVMLEGGYSGCGPPDTNARDTNPSATILSGDLLGNDPTGNEFRDCCNSTYLPGYSDSLRWRGDAWRQPAQEIHL